MYRTKCFAALALFVFCLCVASPARGSARHDLNGEWQFRTDASKEGEARGWAKKAARRRGDGARPAHLERGQVRGL